MNELISDNMCDIRKPDDTRVILQYYAITPGSDLVVIFIPDKYTWTIYFMHLHV